MSEIWIRFSVVAVALLVVLVAVGLLRNRGRALPETIGSAGFLPGIYLFTSSSCLDCGPARKSLLDALGVGGFTEISWESRPGTFDDLGISAVPSTMIVREEGDSKLYPGLPVAALRDLGP